MEPLASANVAIRNAAMILRTDVARDDEPRDWFTIEDVADRVPEGVDEPVIAETLELMVDRGLLMSYGGRNTVRRFFAPETVRGRRIRGGREHAPTGPFTDTNGTNK